MAKNDPPAALCLVKCGMRRGGERAAAFPAEQKLFAAVLSASETSRCACSPSWCDGAQALQSASASGLFPRGSGKVFKSFRK